MGNEGQACACRGTAGTWKGMRMMRKDYLEGSTRIAQDGKQLQLEYYLIEEKRDERGGFLYGIMIKKETRENGRIERSKAEGKAVSYSRAYVERMLQLFLKNTVTPLTMLELIDEYVSREGLSA